jgi:hydrogenase maturation factor
MTGEIIEIYLEEGSTTAKVRVDDSIITVPLLLLMNARVGDHILVDAGIALSHVKYHSRRAKEKVLVHS